MASVKAENHMASNMAAAGSKWHRNVAGGEKLVGGRALRLSFALTGSTARGSSARKAAHREALLACGDEGVALL